MSEETRYVPVLVPIEGLSLAEMDTAISHTVSVCEALTQSGMVPVCPDLPRLVRARFEVPLDGNAAAFTQRGILDDGGEAPVRRRRLQLFDAIRDAAAPPIVVATVPMRGDAELLDAIAYAGARFAKFATNSNDEEAFPELAANREVISEAFDTTGVTRAQQEEAHREMQSLAGASPGGTA